MGSLTTKYYRIYFDYYNQYVYYKAENKAIYYWTDNHSKHEWVQTAYNWKEVNGTYQRQSLVRALQLQRITKLEVLIACGKEAVYDSKVL